ncbi:hypothetical protein NDU88_001719 [Pleurodeles waltl]|uniref:Uncharacterized protein n=1 Tax=Pleurodeles waltl TaxID=8319 RepID=A0AAV7UTK7_PLEWA|nr:hypothetical protein NDU88_001719 [Pleurodeles waltl]
MQYSAIESSYQELPGSLPDLETGQVTRGEASTTATPVPLPRCVSPLSLVIRVIKLQTAEDQIWYQAATTAWGNGQNNSPKNSAKQPPEEEEIGSGLACSRSQPLQKRSLSQSPTLRRTEETEEEFTSKSEIQGGKGVDGNTLYNVLSAITTATSMNTDKLDIQISMMQTMPPYIMAIDTKMEKLNSFITSTQSYAAETYLNCRHSPVMEKLAELPRVMKNMIIEIKNTTSLHNTSIIHNPNSLSLQIVTSKDVQQPQLSLESPNTPLQETTWPSASELPNPKVVAGQMAHNTQQNLTALSSSSGSATKDSPPFEPVL